MNWIMKYKDKYSDNYGTGVVLAAIVIPVTYLIADGLRSLVVKYKGDPYLYPPPAAQLVSLLFSIILFRILMINLKKEKTGKGYFFILALTTFVYFFIYNKVKTH